MSARPIAGRSADRGGGLVTRGLGTTRLMTRGYGGDAFERGLEVSTLSAVDRGATLASRTDTALSMRVGLDRGATLTTRTDRALHIRTACDVEIREISLLTEGVTPWRRW